MNENLKIKKLWHYLQIQDELLIIQVHNSSIGKDEYLIVEMVDDEPQISKVDDIQCIYTKNNLRIIRQRDESGNYIIPDVEQIIHDKNMDY